MKLFLDDVREPKDCFGYMFHRIGQLQEIYLQEWMVVRNYEEFVEVLEKNIKQITHISYDHDLAEEHYVGEMYESIEAYYNAIDGTSKTGYDAAKFMKQLYDTNHIDYPQMFVHSMNPAGTQNIINLFK